MLGKSGRSTASLSQEAHERMAELIEAYDLLVHGDFAARTSDSQLAMSCELFSLEELQNGGLHEVLGSETACGLLWAGIGVL